VVIPERDIPERLKRHIYQLLVKKRRKTRGNKGTLGGWEWQEEAGSSLEGGLRSVREGS